MRSWAPSAAPVLSRRRVAGIPAPLWSTRAGHRRRVPGLAGRGSTTCGGCPPAVTSSWTPRPFIRCTLHGQVRSPVLRDAILIAGRRPDAQRGGHRRALPTIDRSHHCGGRLPTPTPRSSSVSTVRLPARVLPGPRASTRCSSWSRVTARVLESLRCRVRTLRLSDDALGTIAEGRRQTCAGPRRCAPRGVGIPRSYANSWRAAIDGWSWGGGERRRHRSRTGWSRALGVRATTRCHGRLATSSHVSLSIASDMRRPARLRRMVHACRTRSTALRRQSRPAVAARPAPGSSRDRDSACGRRAGGVELLARRRPPPAADGSRASRDARLLPSGITVSSLTRFGGCPSAWSASSCSTRQARALSPAPPTATISPPLHRRGDRDPRSESAGALEAFSPGEHSSSPGRSQHPHQHSKCRTRPPLAELRDTIIATLSPASRARTGAQSR